MSDMIMIAECGQYLIRPIIGEVNPNGNVKMVALTMIVLTRKWNLSPSDGFDRRLQPCRSTSGKRQESRSKVTTETETLTMNLARSQQYGRWVMMQYLLSPY